MTARRAEVAITPPRPAGRTDGGITAADVVVLRGQDHPYVSRGALPARGRRAAR